MGKLVLARNEEGYHILFGNMFRMPKSKIGISTPRWITKSTTNYKIEVGSNIHGF